MGYDVGNVPFDTFQQHQLKKNEGFDQKARDKEKADNKETFVATADTEALLICPLNDANVMFFRTKLNMHNLSFFDLHNKEVLNYVWTETNGDLEASSFVSCFVDYVKEIIAKYPDVKVIILWTDGCGYQNRNSILSSALANFAKQHKVTIYQKYLEVGHTHMECDSVHRCIENAKKVFGDVNLPTDYIQLIKSARKNPKPYGVKYCDYTFFKDYKSVCDVSSIKPCKATGHPYVNDIRQIKYTNTGAIYTNLTYDDKSWKIVPFKVTLKNRQPVQTRNEPIKLNLSKWTHLQEICEASLNKDFHWYYEHLAHK